MPRRLNAFAAVASLAASLAACTSPDRATTAGEDGGTLVVIVAGEPTSLFPPRVESTIEAAVVSTLYERLAEIGQDLNTLGDGGFTPRLARSWQWAADSLSIAFALDTTVRWHDGAPLRADDVRYTWRAYASDSVGASNRNLVGNIDSVTVRDAHTAVFWFKRRTPQQFYDATYHMQVLPSHLLDTIPFARVAEAPIARVPVGTGRFRFARWEPGQRIEVIADTANARGRAHVDRVVFSLVNDFGAATVKLFAGEGDVLENIRTDNLPQLARTPGLRLVAAPALAYTFMGFNMNDPRALAQPHPIFGDVRVRRALTYAVDRPTLVRNVFDSLALVAMAPAPRALIADTTTIPAFAFDLAHARALLDSAGWRDTNGDGVRERDGRTLAFELLTPAPSTSRVRYATLLQEQFRNIGAKVTIATFEGGEFYQRTGDHRFDAFLGNWAPSPGLVGMRQTWTSRGTGNEVGYASAQFDTDVDSALTSFDRSRSARFWSQAFSTIVNDAPAIWLYEQRTPIAVHRRFIVPPLRADGWYNNLADWRVDPAQRIDRDRIGLGAPNAGAQR